MLRITTTDPDARPRRQRRPGEPELQAEAMEDRAVAMDAIEVPPLKRPGYRLASGTRCLLIYNFVTNEIELEADGVILPEGKTNPANT